MSGPATFQRSADETPPVCIVIPTFNRADVVVRCLEHLERQTFSNFEVVMVDDGSTDATPRLIEQYLSASPLRLRYIRQPNGGPASARNRAIAMTQAPVSIIIGDDILASADFVAIHLEFHRKNPEVNAAALGLTVWSDSEQTVTPFMRWLDNGFQFDYVRLRGGLAPDWRHFYTSNLSVKTELLRRHRFDERFTKAIMEDMELGYRIQAREGLRIQFIPEAIAEHIHPMDFRRACNRAREVGRNAVMFETLWPAAAAPLQPRLRHKFRDILIRNPWMLNYFTSAVDVVSRFWCPNPFLSMAIACHTVVGRQAQDRSNPSK